MGNTTKRHDGASDPSGRESLFVKSPATPNCYGATNASKALDDEVETIITAQDEQLDHLSYGARGVRNVALQIHGEVGSQLKLIDSMSAAVDQSTHQIVNTNTAIREAPRSVYNLRTFCTLLWPLVLLMVVVAEGFIRFILY